MAESRTARDDVTSGRAVDRLVNFSDAVVAVAITLMLVNVPGPTGDETMLTLFGRHWPQILTFLFTFYVVAIMWSTHNRILNVIVAYDAALFWINTTWLATIVLLPWLTAIRDDGPGNGGGAVFVYWSMLALISALGTLMGRHIHRHPELTRGGRGTPRDSRTVWRGPAFAGYFLLIGIVSIWWPEVASWMPLGIIPLSIWLRPAQDLNEHVQPEHKES
jgi:uncharacterized membrane protein